MYAVDTWSSNDRASHERGDWWRDQVSVIHCPMSFKLADDYCGRLDHQRSDNFQVVRWWSDAEEISRDRVQVEANPHDNYELLIPIYGALMLRQDDKVSKVGPSQMVLASLDRPLDLRHGDNFSSMAFIVPRERLESRLPRSPQVGVVLDATTGLGRIVTDFIKSLHENASALEGYQFDAICDRLVDLVALTCNADFGAMSLDIQDGLVATIRRFVRENAHDPGLSGAVIASRLGWSLRNIQTHLQRAGTTPSDLIREERLALARLRLQDPAWRTHSITQVAYSSGFSDLSTFSNAYRRLYGERPSDARAVTSSLDRLR